MSVAWSCEHGTDGFMITAKRNRRTLFGARSEPVPPSNWDDIVEGPVGRAALRRLMESGGAHEQDGRLIVSDNAAADLDVMEAAALGLPDPVPLPVEIRTRDQIASEAFCMWTRFVDAAGQPVAATREGAAVYLGDTLYRLPRPLLDIVRATEELGEARKRDERLAAIARVRSLLPDKGDMDVRPDAFLDGIMLHHAHAFTLDVRHEGGKVGFDPVPLDALGMDGKDNEPLPLLDAERAAAFAADFHT